MNNEFCGHPTTQPIQYDGHKDYSENERLVAFLSQGFFFYVKIDTSVKIVKMHENLKRIIFSIQCLNEGKVLHHLADKQ